MQVTTALFCEWSFGSAWVYSLGSRYAAIRSSSGFATTTGPVKASTRPCALPAANSSNQSFDLSCKINVQLHVRDQGGTAHTADACAPKVQGRQFPAEKRLQSELCLTAPLGMLVVSVVLHRSLTLAATMRCLSCLVRNKLLWRLCCVPVICMLLTVVMPLAR